MICSLASSPSQRRQRRRRRVVWLQDSGETTIETLSAFVSSLVVVWCVLCPHWDKLIGCCQVWRKIEKFYARYGTEGCLCASGFQSKKSTQCSSLTLIT
ncbi:hypothetical protein V5799_027540 [Amblyomma americanum]|uniref:Uncharacterized protein n=1 Tax=Amblyomma americanum TaxID=6943 RepID=A0AAQ4DFF0_AMBAM